MFITKVVPDAPIDNGFTPLFTAAQFGLSDTVRILMDLGADPDRHISISYSLE